MTDWNKVRIKTMNKDNNKRLTLTVILVTVVVQLCHQTNF